MRSSDTIDIGRVCHEALNDRSGSSVAAPAPVAPSVAVPRGVRLSNRQNASRTEHSSDVVRFGLVW